MACDGRTRLSDYHRWETVGLPNIERTLLHEIRLKLSMNPVRFRRESESQNRPPKRKQLEMGAHSRDLCFANERICCPEDSWHMSLSGRPVPSFQQDMSMPSSILQEVRHSIVAFFLWKRRCRGLGQHHGFVGQSHTI